MTGVQTCALPISRERLLLAFGDTSELPRLRERVQDSTVDAKARRDALEALVAAKDRETEALLLGCCTTPP